MPSRSVLCAVFVPTSRDPSTPRLDPVGALLSMVGLSLLLWTIIQAPERGWGSTVTIAGFVGSIAVIGAFASGRRTATSRCSTSRSSAIPGSPSPT